MPSRRDLVLTGLGIMGGAAVPFVLANASHASETEEAKRPTMTLYPIGIVKKSKEETRLNIYPDFQEALLGLEGFSHAWVFYWFDKNDNEKKRSVRCVHPHGKKENPLTGVFACRSPARPNLIAMTLCQVQSVDKGVVRIGKIDAFDSTPILDIKPYIPGIDSPRQEIQTPDWLGS
ncbi:tRNA (N6-threonylcarbamoyladenosine(37)-N6)-methyltransferase TrmO [Planctomycetota bacterium]